MTSLAAPRFIPEAWARSPRRLAMHDNRRQQIALRRAGPGESGLVRELASAFRAEEGKSLDPGEAAAIGQLLAQPELGAVYLVSRDGKTAGYAALCYGFSLEYRGRDAFIDEFYLVPEARNAGLGVKTLALLEREAARHGVKALHLEVLRDNTRVVELYRRAGFRGRKSLLMTKRLPALHSC